jgi:hypothetical protein
LKDQTTGDPDLDTRQPSPALGVAALSLSQSDEKAEDDHNVT